MLSPNKYKISKINRKLQNTITRDINLFRFQRNDIHYDKVKRYNTPWCVLYINAMRLY